MHVKLRSVNDRGDVPWWDPRGWGRTSVIGGLVYSVT